MKTLAVDVVTSGAVVVAAAWSATHGYKAWALGYGVLAVGMMLFTVVDALLVMARIVKRIWRSPSRWMHRLIDVRCHARQMRYTQRMLLADHLAFWHATHQLHHACDLYQSTATEYAFEP